MLMYAIFFLILARTAAYIKIHLSSVSVFEFIGRQRVEEYSSIFRTPQFNLIGELKMEVSYYHYYMFCHVFSLLLLLLLFLSCFLVNLITTLLLTFLYCYYYYYCHTTTNYFYFYHDYNYYYYPHHILIVGGSPSSSPRFQCSLCRYRCCDCQQPITIHDLGKC